MHVSACQNECVCEGMQRKIAPSPAGTKQMDERLKMRKWYIGKESMDLKGKKALKAAFSQKENIYWL